MNEDNYKQDNEQRGVVETASATTSKDNQNSGSFAYVITAVALGALLVFTIAIGGCVSMVLTMALSDSAARDSYTTTSPYTTNEQDFTNLEDLLRYYERELGSGDSEFGGMGDSQKKTSGTAKVADVLDFSIAPYGQNIDDHLSASAYADVSEEVRTFVRSVESTDKDYTQKLQAPLNAAAKDEKQQQDKIDEALTVCEEAKKAIDELQIPDVKTGDTAAVKDALGTAKTEAAHRWELMAAELKLLKTTEEVQTKELWNTDEDVVEATEKAAELLQSAMEASTSDK